MNQSKEKFTLGEVFQGEALCDREDELFRYFEGRLPHDAERSFEAHLASCNTCGSALAALQREGQAAAEIVLDPEKAVKQFEKNRTKLRATLDAMYPSSKPSGMPFLFAFRLPAYASAMMLVALAVLIYPAYRSFVLDQEVDRLQGELTAERSRPAASRSSDSIAEIQRLKEENRQLSQPSLSSSALYPARSERGGERQTIAVHFKGNTGFDLVFVLPPGEGNTCGVEILQGTTVLWQGTIEADQAHSLVSVRLHSGSLSPGEYVLKITGGKNGKTWPLAEYALKIAQ